MAAVYCHRTDAAERRRSGGTEDAFPALLPRGEKGERGCSCAGLHRFWGDGRVPGWLLQEQQHSLRVTVDVDLGRGGRML